MLYEEPSFLNLLGIIASSLHILIHRDPTEYVDSRKCASFLSHA